MPNIIEGVLINLKDDHDHKDGKISNIPTILQSNTHNYIFWHNFFKSKNSIGSRFVMFVVLLQ